MSGIDRAARALADLEAGRLIETPGSDRLLFVAASTRPATPIVVDLSGEAPPHIDTDRDRAILRAFLTLALQRLDTQEENTR